MTSQYWVKPYCNNSKWSRMQSESILKARRRFISASPFKDHDDSLLKRKLSWTFLKMQQGCTIIKFRHLSVRPGGPPVLRITGIEFPTQYLLTGQQRTVDEIGLYLASYCDKI
ncbi:hypothetical protein NC652_022451 [Populus alba x Populus x berolinensis]|nr:hypothetical protein NC652_022451 [Populus alba x Populus x berolinensis]